MSFEDLESLLHRYFTLSSKKPTPSQKERVYLQALRAWGVSKPTARWSFFSGKRFAQLGIMLGLLAVFMFPALQHETIVAGTVLPEYGPVEIIRDDQSFLIQKESSLLVGDVIKVGHKGRAKISLPDELVSFAEGRTHLRITSPEEIFLLRGNMDYQMLQGGKIYTDRGIIKSHPGSNFAVEVRDTGETHVALQKNGVDIQDLHNGQISLYEGEAITLSSDTQLSDPESLTPYAWTTLHSKEVLLKASIVRSKILSAVNEKLGGKEEAAQKSFGSAQTSFLSIAEVTQTDRQKELFAKRRTNFQVLSISDVIPLLESKTENQILINEVEAVENLLNLVSTNWNKLAFGRPRSGVTPFDRMVLLYHLYSLAPERDQVHRDLLADQYAHVYLQGIASQGPVIDQISLLGRTIDQLPQHPYAQYFLERVARQADPYLRAILHEKMDDLFGGGIL